MPARTTRVVRDCQHPGAPHKHGTRSAYQHDSCRCDDCTAANTKAKKAYVLDVARTGRRRSVEAGPVRAHLRKFIDANLTYPQISKATGVPTNTLRSIVLGVPEPDGTRRTIKRVSARNSERILATPPPDRPDPKGKGVDPTGARRRLQALMALGWSGHRIATHAGVSRSTIFNVLADKPLHASVRDRIITAYQDMQHLLPEARDEGEARAITRTLNRARKAGWAPPAAWDEEDLDNPEAPEPTATTDTRRADYEEVFDEWLFLVELGTNHEEATERVGVSNLRTLRRAARNHGRLDVIARLNAEDPEEAAGRLSQKRPA